ncbi:hypothetical protein [Streptomyces sp. S1]|uniref:hypothetical protein n=1 Tax=Streptomyces sp. S1 TaxID=718288 RepID=UPI003D71F0B1
MSSSARALSALTAGLVCLALVGASGCTAAPDDGDGRRDGTAPTAASRSDPPPVTVAPSERGTADFCRVERPEAWAAAEERGRYGSGSGAARRGVAVGADGETVFAVEETGAGSELVALRDRGRKRRVVHALTTVVDGRKNQYGSARFDGRWLVFEVGHDVDDWNDWSLYAWDSAGGSAPFLVTRHDKAVPGPALLVRVHGGKAAWTEGARGGGQAVHLYDLAAREDAVVRTGRLGPVFLAGDLLGWREDPGAGGPVTVRAVSAGTGGPAAPPPVIAGIPGTAHLTGDGETWAWVSPDLRTLYAWRPGWEESATVARAAEGETVGQVEVTGDLVTWTGGAAVWAADLRSHSRTALTPGYGYLGASGTSLLVGYLPEGFGKDPAARKQAVDYVLRARELPPLPDCPAWIPVPQPATETGSAL